VHAPLAVEVSEQDLRVAAYEALLLAAAGDGGGPLVSEELIHTVRGRLGLPLRTHRCLALLLRTDEPTTFRRVATEPAGCPAHRARLLLAARPSEAASQSPTAEAAEGAAARRGV